MMMEGGGGWDTSSSENTKHKNPAWHPSVTVHLKKGHLIVSEGTNSNFWCFSSQQALHAEAKNMLLAYMEFTREMTII